MKKNVLNSTKTTIIAEGCDNHFGSLSNAKKMVLQAKKAGADVIKFQHHLPDEEMLRKVPKSKNFKSSLYSFLKKYSLKIEDHEELMKFSKKNKIKYLCTPFSYKAACELNEIGVKWFKVGSGEFTDLPFIRELLKFKKPIILSTGMSSVNEVEMVYKFVLKYKKNDFAFMNCTSEYPPELNDINLNFIKFMKKKFNKAVIGHSDHTNSIATSLGAVAIGAKIIEKHVFLNGLNYGPDRHVSISFQKFAEMVNYIRQIEKALGKEKKVYPKETIIRKWATRSLYAVKDLYPGDKITKHNIWSIRPGTGIPSRNFDKVLGMVVKNKIEKKELLNFKKLGKS
jgi:N-acetylneuraminate synthase